MPTTIKDADGVTDIEVFTAEEVKAQNEAALAAYQAEHPDQSDEIKAANDAKVAAETALATALSAGGDTKDENIKALRVALKAAEDKATQIETKTLQEINALKNAPTLEYKGELLGTVARGDAVLKEKIEIKYASLAGMPETTKAEVRLRMEEAMKLAVDNYRPGMLDGATGMGARGTGGMPRPVGSDAHATENEAAIAGALGITDENAKKYAPKPGQPGYQA